MSRHLSAPNPYTFDTIKGPAAYASYYINGDASGLEEDEIRRADEWLEIHDVFDVIDCSDEPEFSSSSDAWGHTPYRAGDVLDYTIMRYAD